MNGISMSERSVTDKRQSTRPISPYQPIVLALAMSLVAIFSTGVTRAEVIRVEADGSGDQPTIQAGLVNAADGDVVELGDGIYRGSGNREVRFFGKDVTVLSASGNPESCIIDCQGSSDTPYRGFLFVDGETNGAVLQAVSIINGWKGEFQFPVGDGAAVLIDGSAPVIRDCIFERNFAQRGAAVRTRNGDGVILERCIFRNNYALLTGGAVFLHGSGITVQGCVITGNLSDGAGGGLLLETDATGLEIIETTLAGNRALRWGGGFASGAKDALFDRVILWGNCAGSQGQDGWFANSQIPATFFCCALDPSKIYSGAPIYDGEQVKEDPMFCGPELCSNSPTAAGDYQLDADSPCQPGASPCQSLIGALGQGCGAVPSIRTSWGSLKARFQ